jgi:hypothetical protein
MRLTFLAALLTLSLLPVSLRAQSEDAAVLAVVQQLFDAMRARDTAKMRATLHPDARMVSPGVRDSAVVVQVESPDGWLGAVARSTGGMPDERIRNPVVRVDGPLASVWVDYAFYIGDRFSHCGVDTFHLVRIAAGWRIIDLADTRRRDGCPDAKPQ